MNDLFVNICVFEMDDRNVVVIFKVDVDKWIDVDDSIGYGVNRDDVGKYFSYLFVIKFIGFFIERGRLLFKFK